MDSSQSIFKINDLFDNYDDIKEKMELYSATTHYKFSTANSKTLKSLKNIRQDFNVRLIYDEKYYRRSVNPKPSVLKQFKKENPRLKVVLCPAAIAFRTTQDKRHLKVTQFIPNHDHDPFDPPRLEKYKNEVVGNIIQHNEVMVEVSSPQPQAAGGSDDNINIITDSPIDFDEEFSVLLSKLEINIKSTINKNDQKNKLLQLIKMLTCFETDKNDYVNQTLNYGTIQSKVGSLSIYTSRSRGRGRGRKNRVIGLTGTQTGENSKTFEGLSDALKKIYILKLMFTDKNVIDRVVVNKEKIRMIDSNHLKSENIPDALASEMIEADIVKKLF
ncbi:uncharacterized protein LOC130673546 [Microplitis mediator]|uniref:uncharacterized protein LOC130673546 n=1 Tax=Microplitis mediator TaxID=375433 RepID=UPI0025542EC6|nr:uncharacterized protein LOC130673546 [Microplitis mediator]